MSRCSRYGARRDRARADRQQQQQPEEEPPIEPAENRMPNAMTTITDERAEVGLEQQQRARTTITRTAAGIP
jgi:hypothetical protein